MTELPIVWQRDLHQGASPRSIITPCGAALDRHHAVLTHLGLDGRCFALAMRWDRDDLRTKEPSEIRLPDAFH